MANDVTVPVVDPEGYTAEPTDERTPIYNV
jgi:hypothetical protein